MNQVPPGGMLPGERIAFDPIAGRRRLELPDGKRVAVWIIVNIEEWNPLETMPRTVLTPPAGGAPAGAMSGLDRGRTLHRQAVGWVVDWLMGWRVG